MSPEFLSIACQIYRALKGCEEPVGTALLACYLGMAEETAVPTPLAAHLHNVCGEMAESHVLLGFNKATGRIEGSCRCLSPNFSAWMTMDDYLSKDRVEAKP